MCSFILFRISKANSEEGGTRGTHRKRFVLSFFPPHKTHAQTQEKSQNTHACEASSRNNNNNNGRRRRRRRSEDRSERVALVVEALQRSATTTRSELFFVEVQARERDGTSDERGVRNIIITSKRRRRSGRTRRGRRKKARR